MKRLKSIGLIAALFATSQTAVSQDREADELTPDTPSVVSEITGDDAALFERNRTMLVRDVLFFAKRHRFVEIDDQVLREQTRVRLDLFPDVSVELERSRILTGPGIEIWTGEVVSPREPARYLTFPDRKPMPKDAADQLDVIRHSARIVLSAVPSVVSGEGNFRQSVSFNLRIPELGATYVVKSLPENPLSHVVYELDPETCCFVTHGDSVDPEDPVVAARLEKGREYLKFLESHGVALDESELRPSSTEEEVVLE